MTSTVDLEIEGMTCSSCAARIEKKLNRMLNMWLRLPGIISFAPLAFVCWRVGRIQVPGALLVLQAILNAFNAIYFADRVVANCALSIERAKPARVDKKAA